MSSCAECDVTLPKSLFTSHLKSNKHKSNCWTYQSEGVDLISSAFKCRIATFKISSPNFHINILGFGDEVEEKSISVIRNSVQKHDCVKVNLELFGLYYNPLTELTEIKSFAAPFEIVCESTDLIDLFHRMIHIIDTKADEFAERDSGWILQKILHLEVNCNKYNPLRASSYIPLPKPIEDKHAVLNIQNDDEFCFAWCIVSALVAPSARAYRTSSYPHPTTVLNLKGINFPLAIKDISKFQRQNSSISVNVYAIDVRYKDNRVKYEIIGPLHYSQEKKSIHINLLFINDDNGNQHYCRILHLSRLVSSQLSKHNNKKYLCDGCLQYFQYQHLLDNHQSYDCGHVRINLPNTESKINKFGLVQPGNILQFENIEKQLKVPFVVYADFESILKKIDHDELQDSSLSYTVKVREHIPYSFAYYIKCSFNDDFSKLVLYRSQDCHKKFIIKLEEDIRNIYLQFYKTPVPLKNLTPEQNNNFESATVCWICENSFLENDIKVRDHCHFTGDFRGAAHSICNLHLKTPSFIPVVIHNLKNYDAHFFIKYLCLDQEKLFVIPQTKEKYISFSKQITFEQIRNQNGRVQQAKIYLRFIDSFQFLPTSLETLASTLQDDQFREVKKFFSETEKFNLIRQKGIFPYDYLDSFQKLADSTLPAIGDFYNYLKDENVTAEEYNRALKVWNVFDCLTLGDYSDIYLKSDVLLLADIFENFRSTTIKSFKLDPVQYYSLPGLSWDSMLKYTKTKLELLTDPDMLHFFKNNVRGGVSTCTSRKSVANNKFLSNFNPNEPISYIMYLDATNLYGYAMSAYLPYKDFRWLSNNELNSIDIMSIRDNSSTGYVFEVDLEYPHELHDRHNDLPFCPLNYTPQNSKYSKLIPNLYDKVKYVVHYTYLQRCLKHGLKLKKIHRGVQFSQIDYLRPYIEFNTKLRNLSTSTFDKNLYKLFNNVIYGKTIENVDKRVDIRLVTHWSKCGKSEGAESLIAKPQFKDLLKFSENLVAVQLQKTCIEYNKPAYIGFCILDISKNVMYDFYYDFLKAKYQNNLKLLYTDTDSFIIEVNCRNFYQDIKDNLDKFDTSNYIENNIHDIPRNESIVGRFKDEYKGHVIKKFFGTGAKAYCLKVNDDIHKRAKGVKKSVIKKKYPY